MERCLSTLRPLSEEGFSKSALRALADGKKFPTKLDFVRRDAPDVFRKHSGRMSISGVQLKLSLKLNRGKLFAVERGGTYILKPVPLEPLEHQLDIPANEHITMQLAEQVYQISTAVNSAIRLADGEIAYVTRRFDRNGETKVAVEDFAQILEKSRDQDGKNFKYDSSYEEIAIAISRHCAAKELNLSRFFRRLVFCYLVSNGDAHLKNFSLIQTREGDHILAPCYDLLNTTVHCPDEAPLALAVYSDGFTKGEESEGFVTGTDFFEFGKTIGVPTWFIDETLKMVRWNTKAEELLERSFLSEEARHEFLRLVSERDKMLSR